MDDLLKAAAELGKLIARQQAFLNLRQAEKNVRENSETRQLLDAFEKQRKKIEELEAQKKPVEVEDKREIKRLSDAVHNNAALQALVKAQADYMELMNKVNRAIRDAIQ